MAREVLGSRASSLRFDGESDDDDSMLENGQSSRAGGTVAPRKLQPKDNSKLFMRDGTAIEFYILNRDVSRAVIDELEEQIESCGGEVVRSPPQEGYVLVDPRTEDGANFISARTTPTRRVVSLHFVRESINRGKIVGYPDLMLFVKQDKPVKFHLHESLDDPEREKMRDAILLRCGNPDASIRQAQALIHSRDWDDKIAEGRRHKNLLIMETPQWLEACISCKRFALIEKGGIIPMRRTSQPGRIPEQRTTQTGRKPGGSRTDFTEEDDGYLIAWMARTFGNKIAGRQGNKAYQLLVGDPRYTSWSHRHTWHSWRERYKNKRVHFDPLITAHVAKYEKKKAYREVTLPPSDGADGENMEDEDIDNSLPPSQKVRSKRKAQDAGGTKGEPSTSQSAIASNAQSRKKIKPNQASEKSEPIKISASQQANEQRLPSSASPPSPPSSDGTYRPSSSSQAAHSKDDNADDSEFREGSQDYAQILDRRILGSDADDALDRYKSEVNAYQMSQADEDMDQANEDVDQADEDVDELAGEDPDVDVETVTQPDLPLPPIAFNPETESEDGEGSSNESEDLGETAKEPSWSGLAAEYDVKPSFVKSMFEHAVVVKGLTGESALDETRQLVKDQANKEKLGKGKGRAAQ